jgi:ABC-type multidrug transport system ATPase subunit
MTPTDTNVWVGVCLFIQHFEEESVWGGIEGIIEDPGFIGSLSGFKNLKLLASIRRVITDTDIRDSLRRVGLDPYIKKPVSKYSLGMQHRLGIAQRSWKGRSCSFWTNR